MLAMAMLPLGAASPRSTLQMVHAGTLIDGTGAAQRHRVSIIIEGERIVGVQMGFETPEGAEVVDLADSTVMPGFVDAHVHIAAKLPNSSNMIEDWLTHTNIDRAFDGAKFSDAMLQQGFTAARDVGGGRIQWRCAMQSIAVRLPGPGCGSRSRLWGRPPVKAMPAQGWPAVVPSRLEQQHRRFARTGPGAGARTQAARRQSDQDHAFGRDSFIG